MEEKDKAKTEEEMKREKEKTCKQKRIQFWAKGVSYCFQTLSTIPGKTF